MATQSSPPGADAPDVRMSHTDAPDVRMSHADAPDPDAPPPGTGGTATASRGAGPNPPSGSHRWLAPVGIVASSVVTTWLLVQGGYPGWMTNDSWNMLSQAQGTRPYTDWHSPILAWFWSHLGASTTGPLVPHLLQVLACSAGILLAALAVGRRRPVLGVALPWLMLVNPAMWIVHYIWRDAYMVSVLVLALGVGLWLRDTRHAPWSFVPVGILSGLAAVGRPYLIPLMMLLAWLLSWPSGRRGWVRSATGAALAAAVTIAVAVVLPRMVIPQVTATRAAEAVYAFDALNIDCEHEWAGKQRPRPAVSPPGLWVSPATLCDDAGFGQVGRAWVGITAPQTPAVLDLAGWWQLARPNLDTVVAGRLQHAVLLMTVDPARNLDVDEGRLLSTPGVMGRGSSWGYPNYGGVEVVALAALSAFSPQPTGLWILSSAILAVVAAALLRLDARLLLLGSWSLLGALISGLLAPANDYRYVAPFAITSWLVALVLTGHLGRAPSAASRPSDPEPAIPPAVAAGPGAAAG